MSAILKCHHKQVKHDNVDKGGIVFKWAYFRAVAFSMLAMTWTKDLYDNLKYFFFQ